MALVLAPVVDRHPALGWLAIAAVVGVWDVFNARSLSSFARSHRRATVVVGVITVAHLCGTLPRPLDPFEWAAKGIGR